MIVNVDGSPEDIGLLVQQDKRFYQDLQDLIRKRRKLLAEWSESSKIAEAYKDLPGGTVLRDAYELEDEAEIALCCPAFHAKHSPHPSGACLRVVSAIETGIDHGLCICEGGEEFFIAKCKPGTATAQCFDMNAAAYLAWKEEQNVTDENESDPKGE